ncbi:MAG: tandem-95 repeat protein [Alphaproteobacteria bacterium]|nr:tandem-95 repeat protein [Alphaproteobacteria bacterium]MBP7757924.1 tandem-95 repeat protein [Alphaproteobacteria bacterium]MBP7761251.1 tandem-95 repeat protein [Alphaproteobacteria bacterium]MBP7904822.1 tandem-95 repeat protein [Alphaproteobacteria bacterium]
MAVIYGTEQNDDGITNTVLRALSSFDTVYGLGGDDVIHSDTDLYFDDFTAGVNQLYGGTGNDTYIISEPITWFIYSTPIIWITNLSFANIYETPSETDTADRVDATANGMFGGGNVTFDGDDLTIAYSIRLIDNYGVDSEGNLLAGVDYATMYIPGGTVATIDLKVQHAALSFIRNGTDGDDSLNGTAAANVIDGRDGSDTIYGAAGRDFITGGTGDDTIYADDAAGTDDDETHGGSGDDTIYAYGGADSLHGMGGNDGLFGGTDSDLYLYDSVADGHDVITDESGLLDTILLGPSIVAADVVLENIGTDLKISFVGHPEASITIIGQSAGNGGRVEKLQFADGTSIDLATLTNHAPVTQDDIFDIVEGDSIQGNVFADNGNGADSDPDGDNLSLTAATLTTANGGTVTLLADGNFTYQPAAGFTGADTFTYTALDGLGGATPGTVTVNIAGNIAPDAKDDLFATNEDTLVSGYLLADNGNGADSDGNGDALVVQAVTKPTAAGGTVVILANGNFTYTPKANYHGQDSFTYSVSDGHGGTDTATALIAVTSVNDAPDAKNDYFSRAVIHKTTGNLLVSNGSGADYDIDGDALSVNGTSFVTAKGASVRIFTNGDFTYKALDGYTGVGQDSFTYTLKDGKGGLDTAIATLNFSAATGSIIGTSAKQDLYGTTLSDRIFGMGGDDSITGGGASDFLYGDDGADKLFGDAGNDQLFGGAGNDKIVGGTGNDTLVGGRGIDELKGEGGADIYRFTNVTAGEVDLVRSFKLSEGDKIDLSQILEGYDAATSAITDFVMIANSGVNSTLSVDINGAVGGASFIQIATIEGVTGLTDEAALLTGGKLLVT